MDSRQAPFRPNSTSVHFTDQPHSKRHVAPGAPGRVLLQEMLWLLEQKALLVEEEEFNYYLTHGMLGYHYSQSHPSLPVFIPASELQQLEHLCDLIPLPHSSFVVSKICDLLEHNDIPPWDLVRVFKQVLLDFLKRQEDGLHRRTTPLTLSSTPHNSRYPPERITNQMAENASESLSDESSWNYREEIPTISSYVDKQMHARGPYLTHRDWTLPFCHPFTYEDYSTGIQLWK